MKITGSVPLCLDIFHIFVITFCLKFEVWYAEAVGESNNAEVTNGSRTMKQVFCSKPRHESNCAHDFLKNSTK